MHITPLDSWIAERIGCPTRPVDRAVLGDYQQIHLAETLAYARRNSSFYHELFSGLPEKITGITELPFTYPDNLRTSAARLSCVPQDDIQRIVSLPTSGTTGQVKRVFFSAADLELTVDFFRVGMSTLVKPGDCVLVLFPSARPDSVGDLLRIGLERLGCRVLCADLATSEADLLIQAHDVCVNVIAGAPTQILRLAALDEITRVLDPYQIKSILSSSDVLSPAARLKIERTWGCEVFDHFGMTETGLGGGVECEAHDGCHLREADLWVEIIDPYSGLPVDPGEPGEVVFTTLTRTGMPLIRYRTGDRSRLLTQPCRCGSTVWRLEQFGDRPENVLTVQGGTISLTEISNLLLPIPGLLDYTCQLTSISGRDTLLVTAYPVPEAEPISPDALQTALQPLTDRLDLQIDLNSDPASLPLFNSQIKRVLTDLRPNS